MKTSLFFLLYTNKVLMQQAKELITILTIYGTQQTFNVQAENCMDLLSNKLLQKNSTIVLKPWDLMVTIQQ